jgi:uncharacterized protein YecT (DUF1311 family)
VALLKNADAIVTPLATLAQVSPPSTSDQPTEPEQGQQSTAEPPQANPAPVPSPPPVTPAAPVRPVSARPSFDCSDARTRGEVAVCSDAGLAALDRQMAAQFARAFAAASSEERDILRQSAHRFYAYRDRCPTNACIGDAYTGRMREIRDIMEGRWQLR